MKDTIIKITGGKKLRGEVTPIPNKNSFMAVLPAALLSNHDVVYENVPDTSDVNKLLKILELLGAKVDRQENRRVLVNCKDVNNYIVDEKIGGQFRSSLMCAGPLLARFGKALIPMPGGCALGFRGIEAHIDAFMKVGVKIEEKKDAVLLIAPKKVESKYVVYPLETSVTATENLVMYAAGVGSEIQIIDAACEPHAVDLCHMLERMGSKIEGIGSNNLTVRGKEFEALAGTSFESRPDHVDIAGYIVAAAITDGEITIKGANIPDMIDGMLHWFTLFGIDIEKKDKDLIVKRSRRGLGIDENSGFPLAAPNLPKLAPRPWPGFPADVIPVMATLACKTEGRLLLQNWMYEDGFQFVRELNSMGADIFISSPQNIIINGPIKFHGGNVTPPQVIQAMKAVFLAALCDEAPTTMHGVDILKRRYPNIFEVYKRLGAQIEVL